MSMTDFAVYFHKIYLSFYLNTDSVKYLLKNRIFFRFD